MEKLKIVFLHPDLGIGGAERAVIDAALALKSHGHQVHFFTSHHDPNHCFQETRDGTLSVTVVGDWLPRSFFGRCQALFAYLRMIYAALFLVLNPPFNFDVIFCDQISACIYFLKSFNAKVLFYCHFPDMLLTKRESLLKKLYRIPIDWMEEKTTGMADCILVNSKFTGKNIILPTTLVVSMLTLNVVDCWFEPCSSQTKDLNIDICCFSAKYTAFRNKRKDKMTRNQDNVSEWGHMCTLGLLFYDQ
jgi:alpha-1,3/alpha-1,6-mannosyltransferase